MEIFIFPDLLYALVLANILSPEIWKWREDSWFQNIEKRTPLQRVNRLKQYIMNNYVFNLDLETWGLTTKEKELERCSPFYCCKQTYQKPIYYFNAICSAKVHVS